ncbi:MAG: NUDIX domain-containing protein [Candidatus Sungbacteria bacterium]|nr:NUDIX domain-containing protein [Candidatus Sungbacteria bacterium]
MVERSAGIIIFKKTALGRRYLVLHAARNVSRVTKFKITRDFWDFPKGLLDKGETGLDAAKRETREEAGISKFKIIPGFKETARYFTRHDDKKPTLKFVAMFLAEVKNSKVKLSWEHDIYNWLSYQDAREQITLPQMKAVLEKAEGVLNRNRSKRKRKNFTQN